MKIYTFFLLIYILIITTSCGSYEKDGPELTIEYPSPENYDTLKNDDTITYYYSAKGKRQIKDFSIKLDEKEVFMLNQIDKLDYSNFYDTILNTGNHLFVFRASDSEGLAAVESRNIVIEPVDLPKIQFDTNYIHSDTILYSFVSKLDFGLKLIKTERYIDSLVVSKDSLSNIQQKYAVGVLADTIFQSVALNVNDTIRSTYLFKCIDVRGNERIKSIVVRFKY